MISLLYMLKLALICGLPQHGKSSVALALSFALNVPFANSSDPIYAEVGRRLGRTETELMQIPKEDLRPFLIEVGDEMCREDPACLIRILTSNKERPPQIITGVRKPAEMKAVRSEFDTKVIWVHRPGMRNILDNTNLTRLDADTVINNLGTLEDLRREVAGSFAEEMRAFFNA